MASIFGGFGVKGEWMAKKFSQLRAAMNTEARAQVSERAKAMLQKIALHELHQARDYRKTNLMITPPPAP